MTSENTLPADTSSGGDAGAAPSVPGDERSRVFAFEHRVFAVQGGFFSIQDSTGEAVFHVPLGDLDGALPLATLRLEFKLEADSHDGKLLDLVEKGLRFVKEIRPFDSIPHELLDGTASWSVEERHRQIARNRMTVQLVSWMTGGETVIVDVAQLEQIAEDPQTKQRVQEAFGRAAEKLGLGSGRRQEVVDRVDQLGRELAYIEALRDRYTRVKQIAAHLDQLQRLYRRDQSIRNDIFRMLALIKTPLANLESMFGQCDAQTGEILSMLKNLGAQVRFIRDVRDELHHRFMLWDDMIGRWSAIPIDRSPEMEALLKDTYRFLARHFSTQVEWPLATKR